MPEGDEKCDANCDISIKSTKGDENKVPVANGDSDQK